MDRPTNVRAIPGANPRPTEPDVDRHVHILLFGLMGAGKSTVGHLVANELGRPFVDSDSLVELRSGSRPPGLVERMSVDELHRVELTVLRQVLAQRDSVVFASAASVLDTIGPDDLGSAWCVWLDTSPTVLAARIRADRHERPLVGDDPERVITAQYEARAARGRELAAVSVATDDRTPAEITALVCRGWRDRASGSSAHG